jgi:hypothetical protein
VTAVIISRGVRNLNSFSFKFCELRVIRNPKHVVRNGDQLVTVVGAVFKEKTRSLSEYSRLFAVPGVRCSRDPSFREAPSDSDVRVEAIRVRSSQCWKSRLSEWLGTADPGHSGALPRTRIALREPKTEPGGRERADLGDVTGTKVTFVTGYT